MRTLPIICLAFVFSCGGASKPTKTVKVEYDPELLEACLVEEAQTTEPSCVREVDDLGRVTWKYPMGKTSDFERLELAMEEPRGKEAGVSLTGALIRKAGYYACRGDGKACDLMRAEVACEAEVARFIRAGLLIKLGQPKDAFHDVAAIVRAGPSHYRYDSVPELLEKLKPSLPSGVVDTCITQFDYRAYDGEAKRRDPHYRPYTKDNPAP